MRFLWTLYAVKSCAMLAIVMYMAQYGQGYSRISSIIAGILELTYLKSCRWLHWGRLQDMRVHSITAQSHRASRMVSSGYMHPNFANRSVRMNV